MAVVLILLVSYIVSDKGRLYISDDFGVITYKCYHAVIKDIVLKLIVCTICLKMTVKFCRFHSRHRTECVEYVMCF